jgi:hypothetical protein
MQGMTWLLDDMAKSGQEIGQWFAQPYMPDLKKAEYRVTLVGAVGEAEEEAFTAGYGWSKGTDGVVGGAGSSVVHAPMMGRGDFVVPVGATTEDVRFANTKSGDSREAVISAAREVRGVVASLVGTHTATACNVSLRVDLARLVVELEDDFDTTRLISVTNEMNGLVLSASLCLDTAVYPEFKTALARALCVEARRRLVLDTGAHAATV